MIWTIDGNYSVEEYNKVLNALQNNNIVYNEYISTKNYKFYIETESEPFVLNYETIDPQFSYFLVAKTKFLQSSEAVKYTRRSEHSGKSALKLAYNDAFEAVRGEYITFFHLTNKEKAKELSREIGKIWYFGKYLNSRYFVFMSSNQYLKKYVKLDDILASGSPLQAEMELFYNAFNRLDRLKKYSQTPAYNNGEYIRPKILAPFFSNSKKA